MTGELVVASDSSSITEIEKIYLQARSNGIYEVELHDHASVLELEPGLRCKQALLSPSSGIVDSHGLLKAFRSDAEGAGALLALCTPVIAGIITPAGLEIEYAGPESGKLLCRSLVNCAGIHAQGVAAALKGLDPSSVPPAFLCKGSYFTTSVRTPFSRLIYSLPFEGSPGIHLSFDMAGQARFGPDSRWVESIDYDVDASGSGPFTRGVKRYWPDLPDGALRPGFAGYFARTYGPGEPVADWMIQGPADHGIPGLINLFGIDSPGLTACMAIAELVEGMV
jgi:L-2-hydroxyglutarate oxidase LhgO